MACWSRTSTTTAFPMCWSIHRQLRRLRCRWAAFLMAVLARPKYIPYPAGCAMLVGGASVVGDFNGDGFPDIALTCTGSASKNSAYTVYVLLGNGDGTFVQSTAFDGLSNLVAGDFNHDGKTDLLAVGSNGISGGESINFFAGNGDGTFANPVTSALPFATYAYALAVDLNQDGYPDLVLSNFAAASAAETVDIFGNNQDGTFGTFQGNGYAPSVSVAVGANPSSIDQGIIAGNFYGNGMVDLAVVDTGATPGIFVIKNTSAGAGYSFATAVKTAYPGLVSATAAPFTSALSDLLVYDGAKLSVLSNNGSGTFTAGFAALAVANTTTVYAAADANGDGHADIYTAAPNASGAALTVNLLSGTASASSAPFTLAAGTNPVTATWAGNANFIGSTANNSQIVNAIATSVALSSSKNPSFAGDSVTFTATVSPTNSGNFIPSGTITFKDGAIVLGTSTLGSGRIAAGECECANHYVGEPRGNYLRHRAKRHATQCDSGEWQRRQSSRNVRLFARGGSDTQCRAADSDGHLHAYRSRQLHHRDEDGFAHRQSCDASARLDTGRQPHHLRNRPRRAAIERDGYRSGRSGTCGQLRLHASQRNCAGSRRADALGNIYADRRELRCRDYDDIHHRRPGYTDDHLAHTGVHRLWNRVERDAVECDGHRH